MNNIIQIFYPSLEIINFEDMQVILQQHTSKKYILINVLPSMEQDCLLTNTLPAQLEEQTINDIVQSYEMVSKTIVLYGKNSSDYSVLEKKNKQLISLGFKVLIYLGGLFEWVLLQDIYGAEQFPTSKRNLDILKYRPHSKIFTPHFIKE